MNKNDLIAAVADATEFSKKDTEIVINATLEAITAALKECERVQLVGFGSFEIRNRAARTGRNPRTGETVHISAARVPMFKPGKALKEALSE